ncbi:5-formyltetrahydrofolate cyclo-ligase [Lachnospiraceae bacterium OttesenSCG-928-D06]|nr:5-formyltetrahydrofolate cyclo-ligase [Lachnospiraceae bacterium OttesenSCG-928-D06]
MEEKTKLHKTSLHKTNLRKTNLRKDVLKLRDALTKEEQEKAAILMTEKILSHQWFYLAKKILCFSSIGSEIDTTQMIEESLRLKKEVYLPCVNGKNIDFFQINSLMDLQPGFRGILEPVNQERKYIYTGETDSLMIMPGVAFDKMKNRIGYGGGFYDRFLSDKKMLQIHTIAVGFACQGVDLVPTTDTDLKPYQVLLF